MYWCIFQLFMSSSWFMAAVHYRNINSPMRKGSRCNLMQSSNRQPKTMEGQEGMRRWHKPSTFQQPIGTSSLRRRKEGIVSEKIEFLKRMLFLVWWCCSWLTLDGQREGVVQFLIQSNRAVSVFTLQIAFKMDTSITMIENVYGLVYRKIIQIWGNNSKRSEVNFIQVISTSAPFSDVYSTPARLLYSWYRYSPAIQIKVLWSEMIWNWLSSGNVNEYDDLFFP